MRMAGFVFLLYQLNSIRLRQMLSTEQRKQGGELRTQRAFLLALLALLAAAHHLCPC